MHVPEGWKRKEFSEVAELGKTKFNPKDSKTILSCIELENIEQVTGRLNGTTNSSTVSSIKNVFKKGDVLFGKLRPYLKKYFYCNFDGICSTEIWVLRARKGCTNSYLFNLVQTHEFICAAMVSSGSKMPRADWSYVAEFPILLPPTPEQQKITQILSTWDKSIEKLEALIAAKQKRKKALMQQLLTGKKQFAGFEGEWKEVKLNKWIVEHNEKSIKQDEYEVLTSSRNGLVLQTDYFGVSRITNRENIGFNVIPNGYITYRSRSDNGLFTFNINETGKTGIISIYYPVFNFPNGDNKFFVELFSFKEQVFGVYSVGTSQKVLSLNALKSIKMRIPSKEEQQKIASVLSAAEREIETHQKQLSALKEQKKGLMQQLLTGKKRVKIDEPEQRVAVGA